MNLALRLEQLPARIMEPLFHLFEIAHQHADLVLARLHLCRHNILEVEPLHLGDELAERLGEPVDEKPDDGDDADHKEDGQAEDEEKESLQPGAGRLEVETHVELAPGLALDLQGDAGLEDPAERAGVIDARPSPAVCGRER